MNLSDNPDQAGTQPPVSDQPVPSGGTPSDPTVKKDTTLNEKLINDLFGAGQTVVNPSPVPDGASSPIPAADYDNQTAPSAPVKHRRPPIPPKTIAVFSILMILMLTSALAYFITLRQKMVYQRTFAGGDVACAFNSSRAANSKVIGVGQPCYDEYQTMLANGDDRMYMLGAWCSVSGVGTGGDYPDCGEDGFSGGCTVMDGCSDGVTEGPIGSGSDCSSLGTLSNGNDSGVSGARFVGCCEGGQNAYCYPGDGGVHCVNDVGNDSCGITTNPVNSTTPPDDTIPPERETPIPTTVIPLCNSGCTSDTQCPQGLICSDGNCRNPSCLTESDCVCTTPTPTEIPGQCDLIKVYKNGVQVTNLTTLVPGDAIEIAVISTNATQARIRVNGGPWNITTNRNTGGEFYIPFTIPTGVTTFTFEAEVFVNGVWK